MSPPGRRRHTLTSAPSRACYKTSSISAHARSRTSYVSASKKNQTKKIVSQRPSQIRRQNGSFCWPATSSFRLNTTALQRASLPPPDFTAEARPLSGGMEFAKSACPSLRGVRALFLNSGPSSSTERLSILPPLLAHAFAPPAKVTLGQ